MSDFVFLVGWPKDGFTIGNPINARMQANHEICARHPREYSRRAHETHTLMVHLMRWKGLQVLDIEPCIGGSDRIFVRDQFVLIDNRIVLSRFASYERSLEADNIKRIIDPHYIMAPLNWGTRLEGGDRIATTFRTIPIGWGPRTNFAAIRELKIKFPAKTFLPLELKHSPNAPLTAAEYIHADTVATFLPRGDLVIYREAFTARAWKDAEALAQDHGRDVYRLNFEEAALLFANMKPLIPQTRQSDSSITLLTTFKKR